jgi:hypothetical protein
MSLPVIPVSRKIYVNLQDQNIFAVIDLATDELVGRYSVGKCEGNHGIALPRASEGFPGVRRERTPSLSSDETSNPALIKL